MVKLGKSWLHDLKVVRDKLIREGVSVPSWAESTRNPAVRNKLLSMVGKVMKGGMGPYSRTAYNGPGVDMQLYGPQTGRGIRRR